MGLGVPIGAWLRGDLREWADNLLCTGSLRQDGFFNPGNVEKKWQEHLSGARNHQHALWPILMFEAWRRNATLLPETTATGR
jgi:asparagine synthase (glutamine-hydrolysing)